MKKCFCAALLALSLLFCGCNAIKKDYYAPLRGDFCMQLEGVFCDVAFGAQLSVKKSSGTRAATLTFYAPTALEDTVFSYGEQGVTMTAGELTLKAPDEYAALFSPFLSEGEIHDVTVEGDVARVWGDGFSLFFSLDGVPVSVKSEHLDGRILSFLPQ